MTVFFNKMLRFLLGGKINNLVAGVKSVFFIIHSRARSLNYHLSLSMLKLIVSSQLPFHFPWSHFTTWAFQHFFLGSWYNFPLVIIEIKRRIQGRQENHFILIVRILFWVAAEPLKLSRYSSELGRWSPRGSIMNFLSLS